MVRYRIIRSLLAFFALLPLPINHALGYIIGLLFYLIPNKTKNITLINLSLCLPELNDQQRRQLAKQSLIETGKSITELGAIWFWEPARLSRKIVRIENEDILNHALAKQKGLIIMTPHMGCWELAGLFAAPKQSLTSLYRPPRIEAMEAMMKQARERNGATLVPTNTRGVKSLFAALSKHECIGVLPDQDPGEEGGIFVPFFGHYANTMKLIPRLAQKTGSAIILVTAKRLPCGRGYVIRYHEVDENIYSKDLTESASAMNRSIESVVRENPGQYQWSYKRFKRQAPGKRSPYQTD